MITITQTVNLSLTENLVPAVIHAKQYDNLARQVKCSVYQDNTQISLDSSVIVNVSGSRPDGRYFQYSSSTDSSVVFISDGCACFWITDVMTSNSGRVAVDVTLADRGGTAIGTFALILRVEQASVESEGLTTSSYSALAEALAENIVSIYVDDNGYLVIETDDGLGITVSADGEGGITIDY